MFGDQLFNKSQNTSVFNLRHLCKSGPGLQFRDSRKLGPQVFNTSTMVSDRESQIALSVSLGRELSLFNWLRSRIDVGAAANINARICHLTESKSAALEHAHAADGSAAGR